MTFNAVDFDDLVVKPLQLFREHPQVRGYYADRYRYIMVDEFQDTSTAQYKVLRQLAHERRNVCVVGDDDQSIYSWRGANYSNFESFERDFPTVKEIKLERNYRSTGPDPSGRQRGNREQHQSETQGTLDARRNG